VIIDIFNGNLGHPTVKHPVSAPATKDKEELSCITCHSSHSASTGPKLLVTEKQELCHKCHDLE